MAQFEANILYWIQNNLRTPFLNGFATVLGMLGELGILWIVLTLILMAMKKTRRLGVFCGISILLTFITVTLIVKPIVNRPRPYAVFDYLTTVGIVPHDSSFPSGHASNAFACAWVLFRKDRGRLGIPALIVAILISLSRVFCGIHYPSDVLCGALIGIIMSEVSIRAFRRPVKKLFKRFPKLRG